jgi:hypothetical protein
MQLMYNLLVYAIIQVMEGHPWSAKKKKRSYRKLPASLELAITHQAEKQSAGQTLAA